MRKIKRLAWLLCFLFACALLVVTGSGQVQHLADTHQGLPLYLLLAIVLSIPTSLATVLAGYLLEWLFVGWSRSSLKTLWEARASVRLDVLSIGMMWLPNKLPGYVLSLGLLYAIDTHTA